MFVEGEDLDDFCPPNERGTIVAVSTSIERETIHPEGEPILANWWRLADMSARVKRWWEHLKRH